MSAGNHAQAVAYHARRLAIPATIVMPVTTPFVKVKATEALGATVVLCGETLCRSAGARRGDRGRARSGLGASLRRSAHHRRPGHHRARNAGGGARSRGAGDPDRRRRSDRRQCASRRARVKPSIEIVGVECALYPSMWNAIHGGDRPCGGATLAEGIAVSKAGALTLAGGARTRAATLSWSTSR